MKKLFLTGILAVSVAAFSMASTSESNNEITTSIHKECDKCSDKDCKGKCKKGEAKKECTKSESKKACCKKGKKSCAEKKK